MITYTRRVLVPRRISYIVEGLCVCLPPDLQTSAEGADPEGVLYVTRQCQIPLAWEEWVAQPVARSQDFHERVPTSGHLGGTAFLCSLCSSLLGVSRTRVIIIYTTTVHTKTVFRLPWRYL